MRRLERCDAFSSWRGTCRSESDATDGEGFSGGKPVGTLLNALLQGGCWHSATGQWAVQRGSVSLGFAGVASAAAAAHGAPSPLVSSTTV